MSPDGGGEGGAGIVSAGCSFSRMRRCPDPSDAGFVTTLALEGDLLVVGAPYQRQPGSSDPLEGVGRVYVYRRDTLLVAERQSEGPGAGYIDAEPTGDADTRGAVWSIDAAPAAGPRRDG